MEHTPLLMHPPEAPEAPKEVYARRWWLLFVLSAVSFEQVRAHLSWSPCSLGQGWIWNDWGPIAQSAKSVYGWTDGTIALMANWVCKCS